MRAVIQRVSRAEVRVEGRPTGAIGRGLVVLLGVERGDEPADADYLADKVLGLRIFPDAEGKMNLSVADIGGDLLVVSQFTICGDCRRGRRPSFDRAAPPADARRLYEYFIHTARRRGFQVPTGVFQAYMEVELVNDGPVTILLDSKKTF